MKIIDAHHHLWNLSEVNYPWLMEKGATRFFGDPSPIQRNYLLDEHISKLEPFKFNASVHVQVGAEDGWQEAKWIDQIATNSKNWKINLGMFGIKKFLFYCFLILLD